MRRGGDSAWATGRQVQRVDDGCRALSLYRNASGATPNESTGSSQLQHVTLIEKRG